MEFDRKRFLEAATEVGIEEAKATALLDRLDGAVPKQDARTLLTDRPRPFGERRHADPALARRAGSSRTPARPRLLNLKCRASTSSGNLEKTPLSFF
jgi:hypothetical protein